MSRIRGKNTKPELVVRRVLWKHGYRYRLHVRDIPGKPDIVFKRRKKVILVHGCFWHRHTGCKYATTPKSNTEFWLEKFDDNVRRDAKIQRELTELGFQILIVWECETRIPNCLEEKLTDFMQYA